MVGSVKASSIIKAVLLWLVIYASVTTLGLRIGLEINTTFVIALVVTLALLWIGLGALWRR